MSSNNLDINPIGKVTHYFCQREYQGRGLQHFHFAIWIEGAPILGDDDSEKSDKERQEHNERVVKFITLVRFPIRHYLQFYTIE